MEEEPYSPHQEALATSKASSNSLIISYLRIAKIHDPIKKPTTAYSTFAERLSNLQQHSVLPNYEPSRSSQKSYGFAKAFGVCTNVGLIRDYNEDRVSIVLDIPRPTTDKDTNPWPSCSLFALFDGHGGSKCADFLRNNLHYYV